MNTCSFLFPNERDFKLKLALGRANGLLRSLVRYRYANIYKHCSKITDNCQRPAIKSQAKNIGKKKNF